jgi:phosphoglycolate phosphatase-like HAD superfamily hydrolase
MYPRKTIQAGKSIVGFDMDGVIIDHSANKIALAARYGRVIRLTDTHSEKLPALIPKENYASFQDELYGNSDFALSAPLMDGICPLFAELQANKIPFVLISRRRKPENAVTLLSRRGLWGTFFDERNAFFVLSPEEKNVIGIREGVTHYFDDEGKVLRAMPDISARFLFDAFRQFDNEKEFPRIFDWSMASDLIYKP